MSLMFKILTPIVVGCLAFFLKKLGNLVVKNTSMLDHNSLQHAINILVRAMALQKNLSGSEKFSKVLERARKKYPAFSKEKLSEFIQSSVFDLKQKAPFLPPPQGDEITFSTKQIPLQKKV